MIVLDVVVKDYYITGLTEDLLRDYVIITSFLLA
jgi:hypothetical protein